MTQIFVWSPSAVVRIVYQTKTLWREKDDKHYTRE